jgi:hypothetical protein
MSRPAKQTSVEEEMRYHGEVRVITSPGAHVYLPR